MRGALLKEFCIWRKNGIWYSLLYVVIGIICAKAGSMSGVLMGPMLATVNRYFLEDEKNCWADYSKALPYSAAHRVSARYIIVLFEMLLAFISMAAATAYSLFNGQKTYGLENEFPYLSPQSYSVSLVLIIAAIIVATIALSLPLNYLFKGQKRVFFGMIPLILAIIPIVTISVYSRSFLLPSSVSALLKTMYYEKWIMPAILAAAIALLAASWLVSIIINTNSGRSAMKAHKIIAAALVAAVAVSGVVSVGILYKNGRLVQDEIKYYEHAEIQGSDSIVSMSDRIDEEERKRNQLECREDMMETVEKFCAEDHLGKTAQEVQQQIEELDFEETHFSLYEYEKGTDQYNVTVRLYTETDSDRISVVETTADIGSSNRIEEATAEEADKIGSSFTYGMSEAQVIEKLKEYGFCPSSIREYEDTDHGRTLYYLVNVYISDYNGEGPANYQINLEVCDEGIWDIRLYNKVYSEVDE